jgi:hypothetical protein
MSPDFVIALLGAHDPPQVGVPAVKAAIDSRVDLSPLSA